MSVDTISPTSGQDVSVGNIIHTLQDNRDGKARGIYCVCSAHPVVLEAAMARAHADGEVLVIESTSNQVDQFGGYTGMKPADFAAWVGGMADASGLGRGRLVLGGDHLGPNAWRTKPAAEAMVLAEELVRQYVQSGYRKIHLDCSMPLGGDVVEAGRPLPDALVAARAARLCRVAEEAAPDGAKPLYVIGTEVPIPGGATVHEDHIPATPVAAAAATISTTREHFERAGCADAWQRVIGLVVQPGVEFGDDFVCDFQPEAARELSAAVLAYPGLVYEAHSTDYQTQANLAALVRGHFAILKVGPWLTFALREALIALAGIEEALAASGRIREPSGLIAAADAAMTANPKWWKSHYQGDVAFKQRYSFSDRIRYYWGDEKVAATVERLYANLDASGIPESLLGQFMPEAFAPVRERRLAAKPRALARHRVDLVLRQYAAACGHGV